MGRLETTAGRPQLARRFLGEARAIFAEMRLPNGEFDSFAALGDLERRLGNVEAARAAFEMAVPLLERALASQSTEVRAFEDAASVALAERGALMLVAFAEVAPPADAARHLDAARALVAGPAPRLDGALLVAQGRVEQRAARPDAAAAAFAAAQGQLAAPGDALGLGAALVAHADLERERGNAGRAVELYHRALAAFLAARDRIGEGDARFGLAKAIAATVRMEANIQYRMAARAFDELGLPERSQAALAAARALN
jgi:tetratricopeptide (TPR) repeat protein